MHRGFPEHHVAVTRESLPILQESQIRATPNKSDYLGCSKPKNIDELCADPLYATRNRACHILTQLSNASQMRLALEIYTAV